MKITVKVFSIFKKYLSSEFADKTEFTLSLADLPGEPKRIAALIEYLQLPGEDIGQIILNGHIKWDHSIELQPNDRIVLQPYIGGG